MRAVLGFFDSRSSLARLAFAQNDKRLLAIAAECEKVGLPGLLETMEAACHKTILDRFAVRG